MAIFDRITSLAGTEWAKASNLAHETFQSRMGEHRHTGRAFVETVATVCRNHPNLVGLAVGIMVERLLVEEKHRHDAHLAAHPEEAHPASAPAHPAQAAHHPHVGFHPPDFSHIKPGKIGWEVFGGLILLKLGATFTRLFRHKHQNESWFAPAARIRLWSGTIAAYQFAKALREPKVSAWRNGMILFFGTDAIKPLLTPTRQQIAARRAAEEQARKAAKAPVAAPVVQHQPAPQPAPAPAPVEYAHVAEAAAPTPAAAESMIGQGYVLHPVTVGSPAEAAPSEAQPGLVH